MRREDLEIIAETARGRRRACRQSAWAKYQKPRRGCRRGLGWQCRGGLLPKRAIGQRGSGACCPVAINHLVARGRKRFRRPTSIFRGSERAAAVRGTGPADGYVRPRRPPAGSPTHGRGRPWVSSPDPAPFPRVLHEAAKPRPWFRHYGCAGSDLTPCMWPPKKARASAGLSFAGVDHQIGGYFPSLEQG